MTAQDTAGYRCSICQGWYYTEYHACGGKADFGISGTLGPATTGVTVSYCPSDADRIVEQLTRIADALERLAST